MGIRIYSTDRRIYLDMDGPIADFDNFCLATGQEPEHAKLLSGTYIRLQPTADAIESVKTLISLGFEIFILSKTPSKNPGSATEKFHWLQLWFPDLGLDQRLILSPDKGCFGRECDFLIDDHPEWANAENFKGEIIKFKTDVNEDDPTGSNRKRQTWNEILKYFEIVAKTKGVKS